MCREQGTARSRERWLQVLDGVSRQRAVYVRVRQGVPGELNFVGGPLLMSGGVCATVGGNESSHRESGLSFLPRRRAVGARNRASAAPRRGGDAAVPSCEARRRRSPSGRVSPHRDDESSLLTCFLPQSCDADSQAVRSMCVTNRMVDSKVSGPLEIFVCAADALKGADTTMGTGSSSKSR